MVSQPQLIVMYNVIRFSQFEILWELLLQDRRVLNANHEFEMLVSGAVFRTAAWFPDEKHPSIESLRSKIPEIQYKERAFWKDLRKQEKLFNPVS